MKLIDADALYRQMPMKVCLPCPFGEEKECKDCVIDNVMKTIDDAPTIDAVPVVHGEWIDESFGYNWYGKCSVCGEAYNIDSWYGSFNYCPNCGARMDGERREG